MTWGQPLEVLSVLDLEEYCSHFCPRSSATLVGTPAPHLGNSHWLCRNREALPGASEEPNLSLMISSTAQAPYP